MDNDPLIIQKLTVEFLLFFVSLLFCSLFSFLETSITALRLFKLKELAKVSRYKELFSTLEHNPHKVLITILIANSLANVSAAALITDFAESLFNYLNFSRGLGFSIGIGLGATAILIFGEVIPKNIAKFYGEKFFKSTLWITNVSFYLLYPFVQLLVKFSNILISFLGGKPTQGEQIVSEREIRFLIDYINEKGLMEKEKTEMLQSIFEMSTKQVKEIMVPATDIVMIEDIISIEEALKVFSQYQLSRLPVYQQTKENIVGMIHLKDVFFLYIKNQKKPLLECMRPIIFIPETMKINQLLREFKQQGMHIAIVLNEFGSITGLVSLEDVLEEIVGEISDEYEEIPKKIIQLEKNKWLIDASTPLEDVSDTLDIFFDTKSAITLGGFLTEQLQHVPKKGETITYKNHMFQIKKASPKRAIQIFILKKKNE